MLICAVTMLSLIEKGSVKAADSRSSTSSSSTAPRLASETAPVGCTVPRTMPNSSPASRATMPWAGSTVATRRWLIATSSWSPTIGPMLSLTILKSSTSSTTTAAGTRLRSADSTARATVSWNAGRLPRPVSGSRYARRSSASSTPRRLTSWLRKMVRTMLAACPASTGAASCRLISGTSAAAT